MKTNCIAAAVASLVLIGSGSSASAQDLIRSWDMTGSAVWWLPFNAAGDVDGDGVGDVMTEYSPSSGSITVTVYSGATGGVIYTHPGFSALPPGISPAGDSDGDGRDDFLIADCVNSTVFIFSGRDGSEIHQFSEPGLQLFGINRNIEAVGDLNGDGVPDIGGIYQGSSSNQGVAVISGADGSTLFQQFDGLVDARAFCMAGDLDSDGSPELWIGSDDSNYAGTVTAYSTATKQPILTLNGQNSNDRFGGTCVDAGDVDGDDISDVAIGANSFNAGTGRVYIYSGAAGTLIGTIDGSQTGSNYGAWLAGAADLNGDGHSDIVVGNYLFTDNGNNVGRIEAYSGATLSLLSSVEGTGPNSNLGGWIASVGDVDRDGYADFVTADNQVPTIAVYSLARHPRIDGATPNRGRYTGGDLITVNGKYFAAAETPTVTINGAAASNVIVVDDGTMTCDLPPGVPGPAMMTAATSLGSGTTSGALTYTPAVTWDGSATPGGSVALHFLCDPLDGMLAIYGTDPASIPTPPFDGVLGIVPFQVAFMLGPKVWPFDHFDLSGNIPNDPSLIGVTLLVQALDGPSFAKPKDATWTNVGAITIK